jgi:hypothetical protein
LDELSNLPELLQSVPTDASGGIQDSNFASYPINIAGKFARFRESRRCMIQIKQKKKSVMENLRFQLTTLA